MDDCKHGSRQWNGDCVECASAEGYAACTADVVAWLEKRAIDLGRPCDEGCCSGLPDEAELAAELAVDAYAGKHVGAAAKVKP